MASRKYAYQVKVVRMGKRVERVKLNCYQELAAFWSESVETAEWFEADKECLVAVYLDTKLQLISWSLVSLGSNQATMGNPLEVFRPALIEGASAVAVFHNHPSGDCLPSVEDYYLTKVLEEAGRFLRLRFVDHVVIGDAELFSFASAGFPQRPLSEKIARSRFILRNDIQSHAAETMANFTELKRL